MKWLIPIEKADSLSIYKPDKVDLYLEAKEVSRFGKNTLSHAIEIALKAKELGFQIFLQVDLLCVQAEFEKVTSILLETDLSCFDAVRVQDPGLIYFFKSKLNSMPVHLVLETGNHNIHGVKTWETFLGTQLERIVLSSELSKEDLKLYKEKLNTPIEILGAGRLLIFYTPRSLLSAQFADHDDSSTKRVFESDVVEILASSEESPHTGFPIVENQHGTFMFLPKDYFLLDQFDKIVEQGVDYIRVNFSHFENKEELESKLFESDVNRFKKLKTNYPLKTIKGFFNINKSDVLFPKLKNKLVQRNDSSFCGEVLEVKKKSYIAITVQSDKGIKLGDTITFYSPDGKVKVSTLSRLRNSLDEEVESIMNGDIAFVPHLGGISIKTMAYYGDRPLS